MSADIFLFHSSEADDPATLTGGPGWYIGTMPQGAEHMTTDGAIGPYETHKAAAAAMARGAWLAPIGTNGIG